MRAPMGYVTLLLLLISTAARSVADDARFARLNERRASVAIICHRGAWEFAHENTLDAYRATFELGADGNEIDIRATRDGVLVCFHDDMLDMTLAGAYGDVADHSWAELQKFRFRNPGRMAATSRIPTLADALVLHRDHAGLIMLDVKRPGLDGAIAELLERTGTWDHVMAVNSETAPKLAKDPRIKTRRFKAGLFSDRSDVFADKVAAALKLPGDDLIVDDPRAAVVALGRELGTPSPASTLRRQRALDDERRAEDLVQTVSGLDSRKTIREIVGRARAADALLDRGIADADTLNALTHAARHRTLHKHWIYHGIDGAAALRALILLRAPGSVTLARETLWSIDPTLQGIRDPRWPNPLSWTDWRIKQVAMTSLARCKGDADAAKVCRDYLALSDEQAREIGVLLFEAAAKSLLEITADEATAVELMKHRRQDVRGRAILVCLAHADEAWAMRALRAGAPHALAYVR